MKKAIDIVLLPPLNIMRKAIEINRKIGEEDIKLNERDVIPHISFYMAVVEDKNIKKIEETLSKVDGNIKLKINGINGEKCCLEIEKTKELEKLHEWIINNLKKFNEKKAKSEYFYENVNEKTINWVEGYEEDSAFSNFYPHITLGVEKIEDKKIEENFYAERIAICHLGNFCTCRKILWEKHLK